MCDYVTLIAPTADAQAVDAVMRRHGRAAKPVDNPSIARVLREGERQYLTTPGHCDCGTVLARRHHTSAEDLERRLHQEAAKLARRGWSRAKIARALDDRRRALERPDGGAWDSLEMWSAAMADLRDALGLPYAGLLVHEYSGLVASEDFAVRRAEQARVTAPLEPDCVTIFRGGGE